MISAAAALLAVVVAQAAAPTPTPATELDVTLDPDARCIWGYARLRVVNDRPEPISSLAFWLYPNALGKRSRRRAPCPA